MVKLSAKRLAPLFLNWTGNGRDVPQFGLGHPRTSARRWSSSKNLILENFRFLVLSLVKKNPRAHRNKIGTPPTPNLKNPKYPPLKRGILWTWRFSCREKAKIPGAHKIGAPISGPRIAGKTFYGHEMFLTSACSVGPPSPLDFWDFLHWLSLSLYLLVAPQSL